MKGALYARWLAADGLTLDEFVAAERAERRRVRAIYRGAAAQAELQRGMQQAYPSGIALGGLGAWPPGTIVTLPAHSPLARMLFGQ